MISSKRIRWFVVATTTRFLVKRVAARTVRAESDKLAEKLPEPVTAVAKALPGDVLRAGGSVVVAGKATRTAAVTSRQVKRFTATQVSKLRKPGRNWSQARRQVSVEVKNSTRQLRSQYLGEMVSEEAATDALLDVRLDNQVDDTEPLESLPDPVRYGRRRWRPALPGPKVNRVKRSYNPPIKPWDDFSQHRRRQPKN